MKTSEINQHQISDRKDPIAYYAIARQICTLPEIVRLATPDEIKQNRNAYRMRNYGKPGFVAVVFVDPADDKGYSTWDRCFTCTSLKDLRNGSEQSLAIETIPTNQIKVCLNAHKPIVDCINEILAYSWLRKDQAREAQKAKDEELDARRRQAIDLANIIRDMGFKWQSSHVDSSGNMVVSVAALVELVKAANTNQTIGA